MYVVFFECPCGIAVSPVGNIYITIASYDNCKVQIF